jgi:hypothetical protein
MANADRRARGRGAAPERPEPPDATLIADADRLGLPWREMLGREIALERARRRYRDAEAGGDVLWRTLAHLPNVLLPRPDRRPRRARTDPFSEPDWILYLRVLELENLARVAERLEEERGAAGWRLRAKTGCEAEDARWALSRAAAPARERGRPLDDAVARARAEGLELPAGKSGVEAVRRLQRLVRRRFGIRRGQS